MTLDPMHGGVFNGNACRKLIKKADVLQVLAPIEAQPFTEAFRALDKVVESCFGSDLDSSYLEHIATFERKYMDLVELQYVNVTPKVHAIFHHIPEFCQQHGALGRHSEQASESVHADLKKTFAKYKVGITNANYNQNLLRAVIDYNCGHL